MWQLLILGLFAALPAIAQPATQRADDQAEEDQAVGTQPTTQPATQPYETPPDRLIHVQKEAEVEVLGFSDDGNTLYLSAGVNQLNIGGLLLYYWPEAAAILIVLLSLRWLVRVSHRPQFPGEEHCRHCNYLLKNLPSTRCPECGGELTPRNRLPGRRRWPRMVVASIVILAAATAWLCANTHLPRQGTVGNWLNWRSIRLGEWAMAANHEWVARHLEHDDLVLLADLQHGNGFRKLSRLERHLDDVVLSPDRRSLLGWYWEPTKNGMFGGGGGGFGGRVRETVCECTQLNLSTGKITRRFPNVSRQIDETIHITPQDRPRILFCLSSGSRGGGSVRTPGRVTALNIETGNILHYLVCDGDPEVQALTVGGRDIAAVLIRSRYSDQEAIEVRAWDPATNKILNSFRVPGIWCFCDGDRFYMANDTEIGVEIQTWDILTGKKLSSHHLTGPKAGRLTVRRDTLILQTPLIGCTIGMDGIIPSDVHALNLKTGEHTRWIMEIFAEPTLSPDGRRLAVLERKHGGEVRVYNLPWK